MSRFSPYFGVLGALFVGVLIVALSGQTSAPSAEPVATSSALALQVLVATPSATSSQSVTFAVQATSTKAQKTLPVPVAPEVSVPASVATPAAVISGSAPSDVSASTLREALANIVCDTPVGSGLRPITGSGVFIDPKGIILTNAHIAQYFLLADRGVACVIRIGGPATTAYRAELLYIPSSWIHVNARVITEISPVGTGEHDYALLAVTGSATDKALPFSYPSVELAETPPTQGAQVVIATFGAQFLEAAQIWTSLFPTVVFGSVKEVFTFATNTIDILALGGSAAAQEGSSGGGVADSSGRLVGIITTSTIEGPTATRELNAITASYIRADYASETGRALNLLFSAPTAESLANFAPQIPALEAVITPGLN